MQIRELSGDEYQQFWKQNGGSVFLDPKWLSIVLEANQKVHYYGLYTTTKLVNTFPVVVQKGRLMKNVTLPKLTPFLGWVVPDEQTLLNQFLVDYNYSGLFYAVPEIHSAAGWKELITHQIDLTRTEDELFEQLREDKKRNIKKAVKQGLTITFESDFDLLKRLTGQTFKRQSHLFAGYDQLEKIIKNYPNHYQINVWDSEKCLASLLFVYDTTHVYYSIGGFDHSFNNHNAGPYAMWQSILRAKKMHLSVFDFEGSMIPSIAQYFKSFGANEKKYAALEHNKWYVQMLKKIRG